MTRPRLGAYVLAGDPTWLRSSLTRYYDRLDSLVVSAASDDRGWTGKSIRAEECIALVREIDIRNIARVVRGNWVDNRNPMRAESRQRQDALDRVVDVDWVLQIDTDEIVPDVDVLERVLTSDLAADKTGVEWPMRVLYRRLTDGRYLEVVAHDGLPRYDYPGPIAVRPGARLVDARRTDAAFLRPVVVGDSSSRQIEMPAGVDETRQALLDTGQAIIHNSWARPPAVVRQKIATWGHRRLRNSAYYYGTWLPTPRRWQRMRDFHPLFPDLWPRLAEFEVNRDLLHSAER